MSYPGKLIIVQGVSGSGKGTMVHELLKTDLDLKQVISCKTRPLRPGEIDGVEYHYYTEEQFQKAIESGEFIEYQRVYDIYWYGTRRKDIIDGLMQGENIVKEIDLHGMIHIAKNHPDVWECTKSVFLDIDDELMSKRITNRAPIAEEELAKRIETAHEERPLAKEYCTDVIDGSGTIEEVAAVVYEIVKGYIGKE